MYVRTLTSVDSFESFFVDPAALRLSPVNFQSAAHGGPELLSHSWSIQLPLGQEVPCHAVI